MINGQSSILNRGIYLTQPRQFPFHLSRHSGESRNPGSLVKLVPDFDPETGMQCLRWFPTFVGTRYWMPDQVRHDEKRCLRTDHKQLSQVNTPNSQ
jgi:hypothetical protein